MTAAYIFDPDERRPGAPRRGRGRPRHLTPQEITAVRWRRPRETTLSLAECFECSPRTIQRACQ